MKIALDSNFLLYAEGIDDLARELATEQVLERRASNTFVIPVQCLGELFRVLVGKAKWTRGAAQRSVRTWRATYGLLDTTSEAFEDALALAVDHRFSIWDSVVVAVSANAGCNLLLSEDMQDGFAWGGLTILNPFAASPHPLLRSVLGG